MGNSKSAETRVVFKSIGYKINVDLDPIVGQRWEYVKQCITDFYDIGWTAGVNERQLHKILCIPQLGKKNSEEESAKIFSTFDDDLNGITDIHEVFALMILTSLSSFNQRIQHLFQIYDLNHDGVLSRDETVMMLRSLLRALVKATTECQAKQEGCAPVGGEVAPTPGGGDGGDGGGGGGGGGAAPVGLPPPEEVRAAAALQRRRQAALGLVEAVAARAFEAADAVRDFKITYVEWAAFVRATPEVNFLLRRFDYTQTTRRRQSVTVEGERARLADERDGLPPSGASATSAAAATRRGVAAGGGKAHARTPVKQPVLVKSFIDERAKHYNKVPIPPQIREEQRRQRERLYSGGAGAGAGGGSRGPSRRTSQATTVVAGAASRAPSPPASPLPSCPGSRAASPAPSPRHWQEEGGGGGGRLSPERPASTPPRPSRTSLRAKYAAAAGPVLVRRQGTNNNNALALAAGPAARKGTAAAAAGGASPRRARAVSSPAAAAAGPRRDYRALYGLTGAGGAGAAPARAEGSGAAEPGWQTQGRGRPAALLVESSARAAPAREAEAPAPTAQPLPPTEDTPQGAPQRQRRRRRSSAGSAASGGGLVGEDPAPLPGEGGGGGGHRQSARRKSIDYDQARRASMPKFEEPGSKYTKKDIMMVKAEFDKIDRDHSGEVGVEELVASMHGKMPEEWVQAMFQTIDADGNGKVTLKEMLLLMFPLANDRDISEWKNWLEADVPKEISAEEKLQLKRAEFTPETVAELTALYRIYDRDGDGALTAQELMDAMEGGKVLERKDVQRMLEEAGRGFDDALALQDFVDVFAPCMQRKFYDIQRDLGPLAQRVHRAQELQAERDRASKLIW